MGVNHTFIYFGGAMLVFFGLLAYMIIKGGSTSIQCFDDYSTGKPRAIGFHSDVANYFKAVHLCQEAGGEMYKIESEVDQHLLTVLYTQKSSDQVKHYITYIK